MCLAVTSGYFSWFSRTGVYNLFAFPDVQIYVLSRWYLIYSQLSVHNIQYNGIYCCVTLEGSTDVSEKICCLSF